jgi:hypothetical protein
MMQEQATPPPGSAPPAGGYAPPKTISTEPHPDMPKPVVPQRGDTLGPPEPPVVRRKPNRAQSAEERLNNPRGTRDPELEALAGESEESGLLVAQLRDLPTAALKVLIRTDKDPRVVRLGKLALAERGK